MRLIPAVLLMAAAYVPPTPCAAQTPEPPALAAPSQDEIIKLFRIDAGTAKITAPVRGQSSTLSSMAQFDVAYACSTYNRVPVGDIVELMSKGKEQDVRQTALEKIPDSAACAVSLALLEPSKAATILPEYASNMGIVLGYRMLVSPQSEKDKLKRRVIAYLTFAKTHGLADAGLYLEQFQRNSAAPSARAKEAAEYTLEARDAGTMIEGNRMAFIKKYGGRTLEISGEVEKVSHDGGSATLALKCLPPPSGGSIPRPVDCNMSDPAEITKLDNAMPGMSVKVHGVYILHYKNIRLSACRVISNSTPSLGAQQTPE